MSELEASTKKRKAVDEEEKPATSKMMSANNETESVVGDSASTNQPDNSAGIGGAAAVTVAKAVAKERKRKTFEFDVIKYTGPMMHMQLMASTLNELLDIDFEYDDDDRLDYILNMEQFIRTGHNDYQNPFGEDDQEVFLGMFYKLTQRERKVLLKMAKKKKHITVEHVTKMFEDPPTRPFHVTLKGVSNNYEDGSERFPFTSMDDLDAKDVIIKD
jgi:hypothetical protein